MKLFLVGPYPPPHGGISVHVANARLQAREQGVPCRVLNTSRSAPRSPDYIRASSAGRFVLILFRHAIRGWTIHIHTNGHNVKSWILALLGGLAGKAGSGSRLTLHSGLIPGYLQSSQRRRHLAALICRLHSRVICVSPTIEAVVRQLGVPAERITVLPAFQGIKRTQPGSISPQMEKWFAAHSPVVVATGGDQPVYGTELLVKAVTLLRATYPSAGCLLAGIPGSTTRVRKMIAEAALSEDILMLGDIPHDQCVRLISKSSVFVRPTFADGDSISVREALALEVPVVASDAALRPPGVTTFETGNVNDLVDKLGCVLRTQSKNCA